MARYDLSKENTIGMVLDKLKMDNLIDDATKDSWLKKEYVGEFIKIIQKNYMVVPTYTNERLQRQNGVFLLASMFSVSIGTSVKDSVITKSKNNLREEFDSRHFYIKGENKDSILKELDLYNINEATLFPELEHQLNYIRYANADFTQSVTEFSRYEDDNVVTNLSVCVNNNELDKYIIDELKTKLCNVVEIVDIQEIRRLIESNFVIDWYKRDNIKSKIKNSITEYYFDKNKNREEAKSKANGIMAVLNDEVKAFIESKQKSGE